MMRKMFVVAVAMIIGVSALVTVSADVEIAIYNPNESHKRNVVTMDSIEAYIDLTKERNKKITAKKIKGIPTTITFSELISSNELIEIVDCYEIQVVQLQARGYDKNGEKITFFSKVDKGIEKTYEIMRQTANDKGIEFAGVISMYACVDSNNIEPIQNNEKIFLIDLDDEYVENDNSKLVNQRNETTDGRGAFVHSVAWDAEKLNMVSYKEN